MRLAILADIHGNLPALEAVMRELERLQPDYVVLDGDLINGVPFSSQVVDFVCQQDWLVVRGNHEFYYLDFGTERAPAGSDDPDRWGQLHWLVEQLSPQQGHYLATLPDERTFYYTGTQPLKIAHGVPGKNRVGFYTHQTEEEIAPDLAHVAEQTLISAHTHLQIDRHIADTDQCWHLINPGSVGLPLNGNPQAQFALLESVPETVVPGGWQATHYRVDYDRRPALEAYYTSGMMEAGGIMSRLFYWELCTADPEIILYFRWCKQQNRDPDCEIAESFDAYVAATGRAQYVRERDPLHSE